MNNFMKGNLPRTEEERRGMKWDETTIAQGINKL
jgi:hypothetical protein